MGQVSVDISAPENAEVGVAVTVDVSWQGAPSDTNLVFDRYEWEIDPFSSSDDQVVFSSVYGYGGTVIFNYYSGGNTFVTYDSASSVEITFGDGYAPIVEDLMVTAIFVEPGNTSNSAGYSSNVTIDLKGICPPTITGPSSIQRCCSSAVTYCAQDVCDGNLFEWSWPSGWTVVGSDNESCITLQPNDFTSGSVSCDVRRAQSVYAYVKSGSKSIQRVDPEIVLSSPFPKDTLCQKTTYTYAIHPVCGANNYTWEFPYGWYILSGQGTTVVTVQAGELAQSGEVSIAANFPNDNCGVAFKQVYLHVLEEPPPAPVFYPGNENFPEYSSSYHCGQWWMCSGNVWQDNQVRLAEVDPYVEFLEWKLIPTTPGGTTQWHFNGSNNTTEITGRQYFSPVIRGPEGAGPGKLKVKAIDFCGQESTWTVVLDFHEQSGFYCYNSYPIWCECCDPDPNLPPMAVMGNQEALLQEYKREGDPVESKISVTPNPFKETLMLNTFGTEIFSFRLIALDGRELVQMNHLSSGNAVLDLKGIPSGLYLLCIYTSDGVTVEKVWKED